MLKNLILLILPLMVAALLAGCSSIGGTYYQFKNIESNFHAADLQCKAISCQSRYTVLDADLCNAGIDIPTLPYQRCMAELGWLPCGKGGEGRKECS